MRAISLGSTIFCLLTLCFCSTRYQPTEPAPNKFGDSVLRVIYSLGDLRSGDDLLPFLEHPEARYRREAAIVLASVQDSSTAEALVRRLKDSSASVRSAAAYALGQIGSETLSRDLIAASEQEAVASVAATILEALGKCADTAGLAYLTTLEARDPTIQAGQAWGLYRAGLRGKHSTAAVVRALTMLEPGYSEAVRMAAAHYARRIPNVDLTPHRTLLEQAARSDSSAEVRSAAIAGLAKVDEDDIGDVLIELYRDASDAGGRVNAVRAMRNHMSEQVLNTLWRARRQDDSNVGVAAAEVLSGSDRAEDTWQAYFKYGAFTHNRRAGALLLAKALRLNPEDSEMPASLRKLYDSSSHSYERAQLLTAMAESRALWPLIEEETFAAAHPAIGTAGIMALASICRRPDLSLADNRHFAAVMRRAVESGDAALMIVAADLLRDSSLSLHTLLSDFEFIERARDRLQLPGDVDIYNELQKSIDILADRTHQPLEDQRHRPIDWTFVQSIAADQQMAIYTSRGIIRIRLLIEESPASAANFLRLAEQGYFNDKSFHRVVPNFVIQGGCPRGDGWGSLDHTIRSEIGPRPYAAGSVGMASSGKDTESCQWFITHSATPHLDGRYSIFAEVVEGMDVVHRIEVGDAIDSVMAEH